MFAQEKVILPVTFGHLVHASKERESEREEDPLWGP